MNYGPLVFLAAFFALASSWCGFVLTPHLQIGHLQQTNTIGGAGMAYPTGRPGLARQGLEVYRAYGCAYCHSQQVGQTGSVLDVALTDAGTNQAATVAALLKLAESATDQPSALKLLTPLLPGSATATSASILDGLPKAFFRSTTREAANAAAKTLNSTSAKAQLWVVPVGPDLTRGWGRRRTVAEDYLFDTPVMPGSQRVGPDLANVGTRLPDANWHLLHLYAPRMEAKASTMPPYRFLFEKRKVGRRPSPDALSIPGDQSPGTGYEIVPKPAARALAAYLVSLRADAPLFDAPISVPAPAGAPASTNAPAVPEAASTNSPPTNAPAK
jgi:cbb3-type cytochrome oxidase cytochrome c subunit